MEKLLKVIIGDEEVTYNMNCVKKYLIRPSWMKGKSRKLVEDVESMSIEDDAEDLDAEEPEEEISKEKMKDIFLKEPEAMIQNPSITPGNIESEPEVEVLRNGKWIAGKIIKAKRVKNRILVRVVGKDINAWMPNNNKKIRFLAKSPHKG